MGTWAFVCVCAQRPSIFLVMQLIIHKLDLTRIGQISTLSRSVCVLLLQSLLRCTITTTTTRNVFGVIRAAWICRARIINVHDVSRIKFCVICTSPMLHSWNAPILCSSFAASSHSRWGAQWHVARAQQHWYSRYHRKHVQVSAPRRELSVSREHRPREAAKQNGGKGEVEASRAEPSESSERNGVCERMCVYFSRL